jgi:hypothetical protein
MKEKAYTRHSQPTQQLKEARPPLEQCEALAVDGVCVVE